MIKRTHLAIAGALALLLLPHVNYKIVFFPLVLICALIPDIDSPDSYFGHHKIFRPVQFLVQHRGIFHSFSLCLIISILFALFVPILALSFFLGYGSHLIADSFTLEGITPFWPWKRMSQGVLRTGGKTEWIVFACFIAVDAILFLRLFI